MDEHKRQQIKKQILGRLMELKAEQEMNAFVFHTLASENSKLLMIDEVLDAKNKIDREIEMLEEALQKIDID